MRWMVVAMGLCGCVGPYYGPVSGPMLYPREPVETGYRERGPQQGAMARMTAPAVPKQDTERLIRKFRDELVEARAMIFIGDVANGCGFRQSGYFVSVRAAVDGNIRKNGQKYYEMADNGVAFNDAYARLIREILAGAFDEPMPVGLSEFLDLRGNPIFLKVDEYMGKAGYKVMPDGRILSPR